VTESRRGDRQAQIGQEKASSPINSAHPHDKYRRQHHGRLHRGSRSSCTIAQVFEAVFTSSATDNADGEDDPAPA
jgi:hypothetical protein